MKITKKRFVLIALFIFPLIFFLVLSTGVVNWTKLPVLTERVQDIPQVDSIQQASFKGKVNIVCFLGNDIDYAKNGIFNVNQKIYKEFYGYLAFQAVAIYPIDQEEAVLGLQKKLSQFTDMSKWKFIGMSDDQISQLFNGLGTSESLANLYSNKTFIIDKDLKLRGRDQDKDAPNGLLFGYNMNSVGELNNKMEDDIKVLLYEYRAAFKNKKKADRKKIEL